MTQREAFLQALNSLAVATRRDGEVFVASIDLAPLLPLLSQRFTHVSVIEFKLSASHELVVTLPPSARITRTNIWLHEARTYRWRGLVPRPPRFSPPAAPAGYGSRRSTAVIENAPITAVLRRATLDADLLWAAPCREDAEKVAEHLWRDVWAAIGPELDPHALAQAARFDLPWGAYRDLRNRPDLRAFMDTAPGIGPRFRQLPEGMTWDDMVVRLLGYSKETRRDDGSYETYQYGKEPAFQAWVRHVPWSKALIPAFRLPDETHRRHVDDWAWRLMQEVASAAERGVFDVADVKRLSEPDEWLLFHTALTRSPHSGLVRQILTDPAAALGALERSFGPYSGSRAKWMARQLKRIPEFRSDLWRAERVVERWAERTGQSNIEWSPSERTPSRVDVMLRRIQHANALRKRMGVAKLSDEAQFAMFARPALIARVIADEEFAWDEGVIAALVSRRTCRLHPAIRSALLERVELPSHLKILLSDDRPADVRPLWERLARKNRREALEFLEQRGFDPRAGWRADDLLVLYEGGGEITIRATMLAAELRRMQEDQTIDAPSQRPMR